MLKTLNTNNYRNVEHEWAPIRATNLKKMWCSHTGGDSSSILFLTRKSKPLCKIVIVNALFVLFYGFKPILCTISFNNVYMCKKAQVNRNSLTNICPIDKQK